MTDFLDCDDEDPKSIATAMLVTTFSRKIAAWGISEEDAMGEDGPTRRYVFRLEVYQETSND